MLFISHSRDRQLQIQLAADSISRLLCLLDPDAMGLKSTKKRASGIVSTDEEDDFKFLASQQSTGSDDQGFEMVIAKHYAALREKKQKEKEHKFVKLAYKQLSKEVMPSSICSYYVVILKSFSVNRKVFTSTEDVKTSVQALESIFEDFLQKYAADEDNIHKLWTQVYKEQQKFLTFTQEKLAANVEAAKKIEAGHISGLSRTHAACRGLFHTRKIAFFDAVNFAESRSGRIELRGIVHQIPLNN
ncbi:hypothetical protein J132_05749 [Termitomyces sp. J132]|nr:hypothetical protein J132_05749 [Termitomyces sp. J132]